MGSESSQASITVCDPEQILVQDWLTELVKRVNIQWQLFPPHSDARLDLEASRRPGRLHRDPMLPSLHRYSCHA
jgi:hypothetical protein